MSKQALYITMDELMASYPCKPSLRKLLHGIEFENADEVRIPIKLILEINGYIDCLYALDVLSCQNSPLDLSELYDYWESKINGILVACEELNGYAWVKEYERLANPIMQKAIKKVKR